jgi:hypothetical protein
VSAVLLLLRSLPLFRASEVILRCTVVGAMDPKALRMRKEDESLSPAMGPKAWRNEASSGSFLGDLEQSDDAFAGSAVLLIRSNIS